MNWFDLLHKSARRRAQRALLLSMVLYLTGMLTGAAEPTPMSQAITHVNVVDVEQGVLLPDRTVLLEGKKITRIGKSVSIPPGARIIDGTGQYLLPGLIDAHVHYVSPETYGPLMIAHGVTLVRDLGNNTETILSLRDRLERGELLGPRLLATGAILDGDPPVWPFSEVCDTPEAGRKAVEKLIGKGVDQIKVYSRLQKDPYLAIIQEAHIQGKKVAGHIPDALTLEEAMEAGQDEDEHLTGFSKAIARLAGRAQETGKAQDGDLSAWRRYGHIEASLLQDFLETVRRSGMVQCPTLVVMEGIARSNDSLIAKDPHLQYVPASIRSRWGKGSAELAGSVRSALAHMKDLVGKLHAAGVPLLVGTDLANPYVFAGYSVHREMELFQEAGIPAADVLRAATMVPARFFGIWDRLGSVTQGKTASLVLVRGNPLEDVRRAREIEGVILEGRYFHREALDGLLQKVKQSVRAASRRQDQKLPPPPGKVLHEGQYQLRFQQYDAGVEDFVITRSGDGYHLQSRSRPMGGPSPPSFTLLNVDDHFAFVSARWRRLTENEVRAVYTREGSHLTARATENGRHLPPQTIKLSANTLITPPGLIMDLAVFKAADLKVGDKKTYRALTFGRLDWRMRESGFTLERHADTTIKLDDGREISVQFFTSILEVPMGNFTFQTWVNEDGLAVKSSMKMPFGTVISVLHEAPEP